SPYTLSNQFSIASTPATTARGKRSSHALSTTYESVLDEYPERPPTGDWTRDVLTAALRNKTKETHEVSSGVSGSSQYSEHNVHPECIPQRVSSIASRGERPSPNAHEATSQSKPMPHRQPSSRASASPRPGAEAYATFVASPWNTSNTLLVPSLHHRKEAPYIHPQDNFSIHSRGGSRHVFVYKRDCHEVEGDVRFGGGIDVGSWQTRSTSPGLTEDTEFLVGARGVDGSSRSGRVGVDERETDVPVQTGYRLSRAFVPEEVDPLMMPQEEDIDAEKPRAALPEELTGIPQTSTNGHAGSGSRERSVDTLHERLQVVSEEDSRPILHVNVNRMGTFRSQASHDTRFSDTRAGSVLSMSSAQTGSAQTMSLQRPPAETKPELVHHRSTKSLKATYTTAAAGNGIASEELPEVPPRAEIEAHKPTNGRYRKRDNGKGGKSSVSTSRSHSTRSTHSAKKEKSDISLRLEQLKEELRQENEALREELRQQKTHVEGVAAAVVEGHEESDEDSLYETPEGSRSGTPMPMPGKYPE
ncbi:hypothetical protein LTS18_008512, partial [Coniosporium uncinatum]